MAIDIGKLEKLHIVPFNNPDYSPIHIAGPPFFALINPETYSYKYK
jgi:hypothetical protein